MRLWRRSLSQYESSSDLNCVLASHSAEELCQAQDVQEVAFFFFVIMMCSARVVKHKHHAVKAV